MRLIYLQLIYSFTLATQPYCSTKEKILISIQREGKAFQVILTRDSGVQLYWKGIEMVSSLNSDTS